MSEHSAHRPFKDLGIRLRAVRQKLQESLIEVSGAVEIDSTILASIEQGEKRPSEDILLLLISHFGINEAEAAKLWELAGYDRQTMQGGTQMSDEQGQAKMIMVMPVDNRVVYTDMVNVMANNFGVVMNFMQTGGADNQQVAVARIGMSKEHARSVIEVLQKTLAQAEEPPKRLPAPKNSKHSPDRKH